MRTIVIALAGIPYAAVMPWFARGAYRWMRLRSKIRWERARREWARPEEEYMFFDGPSWEWLLAAYALLLAPLWGILWPGRLLAQFVMANPTKSPGELKAERAAHKKRVKALEDEIRHLKKASDGQDQERE